MRKLLGVVAFTAVLIAPVAFAGDQTPPAQKPAGEYGKDTASKSEMDRSKMAAMDFSSLDKDKDGKITQAEVPADNPVANHFAMLDTDKDGSLSKSEFAKHQSMK